MKIPQHPQPWIFSTPGNLGAGRIGGGVRLARFGPDIRPDSPFQFSQFPSTKRFLKAANDLFSRAPLPAGARVNPRSMHW